MADDANNANKWPLIGLLAVKNLLITEAELEKALACCKDSQDISADLKAYFISNEMISAKNMERLIKGEKALEIRRKEILFGTIAVKLGFINQSVADLALEEQESDMKGRKSPIRIGDMMVMSGFMTERQRDYILKIQKRKRREYKETEKKHTRGISAAADTGEPPEDGAPYKTVTLAGGMELQIYNDLMSAFLIKTQAFDPDTTPEKIKAALAEKDITFGVMPDDQIQGFIKSDVFKEQAFRVAQGIEPVHGKDAKIEYFFNTDYLSGGGLDPDGKIDAKPRGEVPRVKKGTVLAEKTPGGEAKNGQDIYGHTVNAVSGKDVPLLYGIGATLSEDSLKILAKVNGVPKFTLSQTIVALEEYVAPGNVDEETGDMLYDGNVNVRGSVKSGVKVSGNNITVLEVDGGTIEADGDVTVTRKIVGGTVCARGTLKAKSIHNANIACMGNVVADQEIVNSTISCAGSLIVQKGQVISSNVTAKSGVLARNLGSENTLACTIRVGHDGYLEQELNRIDSGMAQIDDAIAARQDKKQTLDKAREEIQSEAARFTQAKEVIRKEQEELSGKISSLEGKSGLESTVQGLNAGMEKLSRKANAVEQGLSQCLAKSERIETGMDAIDQEIQSLEREKTEKLAEKANLAKWSETIPGIPLVKVDKEIQPGTLIQGENSEIKLENQEKHVRVVEVAPDGDGEAKMEIKEY